MADSVFLFTQSETYEKDFKFYGSNASGSITWSSPTKVSSGYTYERGSTYTNFYSVSDITTYTYSTTNHTASDPGVNHYTNLLTASVPWGTNGLEFGTQRDKGFTYVDRWLGGVLITNLYEEEPWDITVTNYQATWNETHGFWPLANWTYLITNNADTQKETYVVTSVVNLATHGTNGSALFRLTGTVVDPGWLPYVNASYTNGWTMAGETPDASGKVFKVFDNGTTNNVSVAITDTNITNSAYYVGAERVTLGIKWKSSNTNDTNWQSGDVFALKGTTVLFKVTTDPTPVTYPTGLPTWTHRGAAGDTQISVTFNTVSSDTNGQWVTVTAGSMASNRVVVFDYSVKFQPDAAGLFPGRATNTTRFGVGEQVNFVAKFDPDGISPELGWSATGMTTGAPNDDRCEYGSGASTFQAGAFAETITVFAFVVEGPSFGEVRTNQFAVVKPINAILKDVLPLTATNGNFLFAWTNVGHMTNQWSCKKKASYFLLPQDVSFHGIFTGEGTGPYTYSGGYFNDTNSPQGVAGFTNSYTIVTNGVTNVFTFEYPTNANHTIGGKYAASHRTNYPSLSIEPNYFISDTFGGDYGPGAIDVPHTPFLLTTLTGTIQIEYSYVSASVYSVTNVISKRHLWSNGKLVIEKASSGPHAKEYTDPDSPD